MLWTGSLLALSLAAAPHNPAEQTARPETVRICQGNVCADQHRSTTTFQGTPVDAEAERRMQALTQLAERDPAPPTTWACACCAEMVWSATATRPSNGCARPAMAATCRPRWRWGACI
jgi:hypothetical protein